MRSTFTTLMLLCCSLFSASAADFFGTWNLNTAKSKAEGIQLPKQQTVIYSKTATGFDYKATGTAPTGEAISATFTYVKDGEEIKTTGFPNWDALIVKKGMDIKTTIQLKRKGEVIGTVTRVLQPGGMVMTLSAKLTLPDGKKASYNYVYDRK
ncbi:MAG: hypothetical protein NTW74_19415 [Acidobacteria bacterium]|nr:hypothetical protein [Acidobacteriota bacterium]